jgi:hypothetical protein
VSSKFWLPVVNSKVTMRKYYTLLFVELLGVLLLGVLVIILTTGEIFLTLGSLTIRSHNLLNPLIALGGILLIRKLLAGSFCGNLAWKTLFKRIFARLRPISNRLVQRWIESPRFRKLTIGPLLLFLLLGIVLALLSQHPPEGLQGHYYDNPEWSSSPMFRVQEEGFNLNRMKRKFSHIPVNYSIHWAGVIFIPTSAEYQFTLQSDDGSILSIDKQVIVDNGGLHGLRKRTGAVYLTRGFHAINIRYMQGPGDARFRASWAQAGEEAQPLSEAVLFPEMPSSVFFMKRFFHDLSKVSLALGLIYSVAIIFLGINSGHLVVETFPGVAGVVQRIPRFKKKALSPVASPPKNWFEANPMKTLIITTIGGIVLVLAFLELGSRLLFPDLVPIRAERAHFWSYDSLLGWGHNAGQQGRFKHTDFSVGVQINSAGLRDKEYPVERTDKKRMLVLGDSLAWGFGVEQHEVFSEVLEQKYPQWEIINAGVSGYGTDQQYLYLKERGIQYRPDVILLLFAPNDFLENASGENYWHYKPMFTLEQNQLVLQNNPVPPPSLEQRLDRFFHGRLYFLRLVYRSIERVFDADQGLDYVWEQSYFTTLRLIQEINALAHQHDARFVLVITPMISEQVNALTELADGEDIPHLLLDSSLYNRPDTDFTFPHDGHWNARGQEAVTASIEEFLQQQDIF